MGKLDDILKRSKQYAQASANYFGVGRPGLGQFGSDIQRIGATPVNPNNPFVRAVSNPQLQDIAQSWNTKFLGGLANQGINVASLGARSIGKPQVAENIQKAKRFIPEYTPQTTAGKAFGMAGEVAKTATPLIASLPLGFARIGAFNKLSPLGKLTAYGAVRGAENAAFGMASRAGERGSIGTGKEIATDFGTGALLNTVMSPRLVKGADRTAIQLQLDNLQKQKSKLIDEESFSRYQRNAGEIEARSVAERSNLTQDQLSKTSPYADQGIPTNQWITRQDSKKMSLASPKVETPPITPKNIETVYHGSPNAKNISSFEIGKGDVTKSKVDRSGGIFFSNKKDMANQFARGVNKETPNSGVIEAKINTKNFLEVSADTNVDKNYIETTKKLGYDGIKWNRGSGYSINGKTAPLKPGEVPEIEYIAFNPEKSVSVSEPTPQGIVGGAGAKTRGDLGQIRDEIRRGGKVEKTDPKKLIADIETQFYNKYAPIGRLEKGLNLKPSQSPSTLIKRFTGVEGITNAKLDAEVTPVLQSVGKDLNNLDVLMVAERKGELFTQGRSKSPGNAVELLRQEVGDQRFNALQEASTKLRSFQDKLLQEWKDVGGLSDEGINLIRSKNQKYTPFQRVMDDLEQSGFISDSLNSGQQVIKTLKGSDRAIESPLESIIQNSYKMQKAIEKNRAMTALTDLGEKVGITKLKGSATGKSTVNVFKDGKKVAYEVPKDVSDAVKGMDEEQLNLAIKAMALPAKILRAGATGLNVGFAVPNIVRDQLSAAVNSKYGGIPVYDFLSGFASFARKDDAYKRWLLSGADQASQATLDRAGIRRSLSEVAKGRLGAGRYLKDPLELLRAVGEFSEKGSRIGVFKRAEKGATKSGLKGFDVALDAMRESREATVDFAQRGSKMKAANAIIPFLNARIQGSGKLLQSAKTRPIQTGLIGTAIATIPAATLYAYNSKFPDYYEIADYEKENNFIIMSGKKDVPYYKIAKGEIGRIFGNPVESFMDYMYKKDGKSFAEVAKGLLSGFSPVQGLGDVIPTAFSIPTQVASNYDTFRKQNIVSPYQKDLPPELQFNKQTSETSKWLGDKLKISPAKIDFVIKGLGAGVGKQALQVTDGALFGKMPQTNELPVVDRFLGKDYLLNKTANKIYENEDKRKQEQARTNFAVKQRIQEYLKTGDKTLLEEAVRANPDSFQQFFNDAVKNQAREDMTPTEKAIQSLPKAQQEAMKLDPLKTTGTPKAGAAENSAVVSKADKAIAKFDVTYGDKDKVQVGDIVYLRDDTKEDGYRTIDLASKKKQLDEKKLSIALANAKESKDLKTWTTLKNNEYDKLELEKIKLDPEYEAYDILAIEEKQQKIVDDIAKYAGYGGFTKPKKVKKPKIGTFKVTGKYRTSRPKVKKVKLRSLKNVRI
jgi:hypothetical protein